MLVVFGSLNADLIFRMSTLPQPGQTLLCDRMRLEPGGKGANQAVAAARDGAQVSMVGCVGEDELAEVALRGLREAGAELSRVSVGREGTGCAAIQTDDGGRNQISVAAGANLEARAAQLDDASLAAASYLLLQMESDSGEVQRLIERAAAHGVRVILNLAPARPLARQSLERLWCLVVNEDEAQLLAAQLDCAADARGLHRALGIRVVRTLGAEGVEASSAEGDWRLPAEPVDALDSTAAGDCFVGVLAAALERGETFPAALERACVAAALACTAIGSQGSLPLRTATDAALEARRSRS